MCKRDRGMKENLKREVQKKQRRKNKKDRLGWRLTITSRPQAKESEKGEVT